AVRPAVLSTRRYPHRHRAALRRKKHKARRRWAATFLALVVVAALLVVRAINMDPPPTVKPSSPDRGASAGSAEGRLGGARSEGSAIFAT
ncbi:MAG: hypothetical protein AAF610_13610, partial [Pseudomonadota bacterium]